MRAVELVHAFAEAIDIVDRYGADGDAAGDGIPLPDAPYADAPPRPAEACGATEAPRGLLYHRYVLDGADAMPAMRATGGRCEQVEGGGRGLALGGQFQVFPALLRPGPLHHERYPVDHDIQEAADHQPDQRHGRDVQHRG